MKILQVSISDVAGGAERSARNLAGAYRVRGHQSWLAVGFKRSEDPNVFVIPNDEERNAAVRFINGVRSSTRIRGVGRVANLARVLAEPSRFVSAQLGREDFAFPGTAQLLELPIERPDIVHLHNLHGGYFDLAALPGLSRRVPTILNVRDGWLMSGHCAFSLGCERWKTGCGECPDLTLYPAVKRDATAFNWRRKREILAASRLYVSTPSQWMMDRVHESVIEAAVIGSRVIPNGVDINVFKPGDRRTARDLLGLPPDARVLMVAANGIRANVWKDYRTLRGALEIIGRRSRTSPVIILAVGETAPAEAIGNVELRFLPFEPDSERLASLYRAADVYLHAAHVESFGNVLLEARACGTPIVASAVGGIPEHVRNGSTGLLVPPGDPDAFAAALERLLTDETLRSTLAENGLRQVTTELTLDLQAERFLEWYREILTAEHEHAR